MALITWEVQRYFPFNWRLKGTSHRIEASANALSKYVDFGTRKQAEKLEYLRCLLINLKISWETKKYIAISLDRNHYSTPSRYRRPFQTYRIVAAIINELYKAKQINLIKGYKDPQTGRGVSTKIKPTDILGKLLSSLIDYSMFEEMRPQELIVLRDEDGNMIDYRETPRIRDMRKDLIAYNDLRAKSKISLKIPYDIMSDNSSEIQLFANTKLSRISRTEQLVDIDLKKTYLVRIFNNSRFIFGGRFYWGAESVLPEQVRQYIQINDQETCELDYSGLHLRMAYNQINLSLIGDPYVINNNQPAYMRQFYKTVSLIMINASDKTNALRGIVNEYRGTDYRRFVPNLKHTTLETYCNAFMDAHQPIKRQFFSGLGIKLQFIDSQISNRILKHFAAKGILALCIHDSYIIDKRYKDDMKAIMEEEYLAEFPGLPPIIK